MNKRITSSRALRSTEEGWMGMTLGRCRNRDKHIVAHQRSPSCDTTTDCVLHRYALHPCSLSDSATAKLITTVSLQSFSYTILQQIKVNSILIWHCSHSRMLSCPLSRNTYKLWSHLPQSFRWTRSFISETTSVALAQRWRMILTANEEDID